MRYTPTLRLSNRLVAFVTIIVVSAMFILFMRGHYLLNVWDKNILITA